MNDRTPAPALLDTARSELQAVLTRDVYLDSTGNKLGAFIATLKQRGEDGNDLRSTETLLDDKWRPAIIEAILPVLVQRAEDVARLTAENRSLLRQSSGWEALALEREQRAEQAESRAELAEQNAAEHAGRAQEALAEVARLTAQNATLMESVQHHGSALNEARQQRTSAQHAWDHASERAVTAESRLRAVREYTEAYKQSAEETIQQCNPEYFTLARAQAQGQYEACLRVLARLDAPTLPAKENA